MDRHASAVQSLHLKYTIKGEVQFKWTLPADTGHVQDGKVHAILLLLYNFSQYMHTGLAYLREQSFNFRGGG